MKGRSCSRCDARYTARRPAVFCRGKATTQRDEARQQRWPAETEIYARHEREGEDSGQDVSTGQLLVGVNKTLKAQVRAVGDDSAAANAPSYFLTASP